MGGFEPPQDKIAKNAINYSGTARKPPGGGFFFCLPLKFVALRKTTPPPEFHFVWQVN